MARGTRMNAAAAASGFLVLYPEQTVAAQLLKCWNWYTAAQYARDSGEAALLAGLVDSVARAEGVAAARVALVGMSAGAAMAANLVAAYPERYSALAMHSGLPALSAIDASRGHERDEERRGRRRFTRGAGDRGDGSTRARHSRDRTAWRSGQGGGPSQPRRGAASVVAQRVAALLAERRVPADIPVP